MLSPYCLDTLLNPVQKLDTLLVYRQKLSKDLSDLPTLAIIRNKIRKLNLSDNNNSNGC